MPGPVLALSLIGPHGQPLFLRNFARTVGDDLKWHYAAHTSLDVFDEREALTGRAVDAYFGLLLTMGDYAVYGYQTNSRIRIVLCVELSETLVKDVDVKTIFRAVHTAYIRTISNPFKPLAMDAPHVAAAPIRSALFTKATDRICGHPSDAATTAR